MSVTWYAVLVAMVGFALWLRGSVLGSVVGLLFFSLFAGGAALVVGVASIQPVYLFLVFLLAQVLLTMTRRTDHVNVGLKSNGYLAFYGLFSAATAFILPKLFARAMEIPPLLINNAHTYYTAPLGPSKQNITTALYLIGTLLASICAGAASADPRSRRAVVVWAMVIAWIHIGFGVLGVIGAKIGGLAHLLSLFRNATYAELIEASDGYMRVNGIFPEPSAYGAYAFCMFVFTAELWLRDIRPRWTGLTAAALLVMIGLCTSTSTYFGLAIYGAVLFARWLIAPGRPRTGKVVMVGISGLGALCLALAAVAFVPSLASFAGRLLASFTVHKLTTSSGEQRLFWAKAGLDAFVVSRGLGIGAGSFRCSSLLFSIMGSTGVIGVVSFAGHVLKIARPMFDGRGRLAGAVRDPVAVAAAWAACMGLLPDLVSAPTPNPGILFAIFGGLALGWRFQLERQRAPMRQASRFGRPGAAQGVVTA